MATSTQAALQKIQDYANRNTGAVPTLETYAYAGVKDANGKPLVSTYEGVMQLVATGNSSKSTLTLKNRKDFGLVPTQVTDALPKALVATANAKSNSEVAALFLNGDDLLSTTCGWISYSLFPVDQ
jgi:hypothetical protein